MDRQAQRDIRRKLNCLQFAQERGSVILACRKFGVSKSSFYRWKARYREQGEAGLVNSKPCPKNLALRTPVRIEEKILHLRRLYHYGPDRIAWYLERYHQIKISGKGVYYVLKRHGMNRLPQNCRKRSIPSYKRYEKQVPGHHIQVDVKFLTFIDKRGRKLKRFQYTAIDDATRIRALKIYPRHTQENAIRFVNYVIEKFPFRLHTIRTDNGHEFQAKFHTGQLKVAAGLLDAPVLLKEFQDFRVTFTSAGHAIFNARQGQHDDLVLAVSLAVWGASQPPPVKPAFGTYGNHIDNVRRGFRL